MGKRPKRPLPSAEVVLKALEQSGVDIGSEAAKVANLELFLRETPRQTLALAGVEPLDDPAEWAARAEANWVRYHDGELPFAVALRLATDGGRLVCTGVLVETAAELTSRNLRAIRLGELLARLGELPGWGPAKRAEPAAPARVGAKGYPREHFERVAADYRDALRHHPRTPVQWMAEQWSVTAPTVHRWLQRARDMGLLEERTRGRP